MLRNAYVLATCVRHLELALFCIKMHSYVFSITLSMLSYRHSCSGGGWGVRLKWPSVVEVFCHQMLSCRQFFTL